MQERLPSPLSPCCSESPPLKHRNKSVLFVLNKNQLYEASPLLTPKDEDDDDDVDYDLACAAAVDEHDSLHPMDDNKRLDANPDYAALTSTLSLLNRTKEEISGEIVALSQLRTKAETASKLDLVAFFMELIGDRKQLPAQHKVIKAPTIQWSQYHPEMASVSFADGDATNECNEKRLFRTLSMFEPSP